MNYERLLAPLRRRMATLIGRCILSAVRSGEGFQTLDVVIMADESMAASSTPSPTGSPAIRTRGPRASC